MIRKTGKRFSDKIMLKRMSLLYSHNNCVRGTGSVDHGEPGKARTRRIDQALPAAIDLADRAAVDQHGHWQRPTGDPHRHRGYVGWGTIDIDPRAVERELDV